MNAPFTLAFQPIFNPRHVEKVTQQEIRLFDLSLRYK
jgi:hypothetical protein